MSKFIKQSVDYKLQEHLEESGLLYKYQSSFRANVSANSCLEQLTDFVLTGIDKGMHTGKILIDLQKAFDTLERKTLLKNVTSLGFKTSN